MAKHEEPYIKKNPEDGELGPGCGHHCAIIQAGVGHQLLKHCDCTECHDTQFESEVDPAVMPGMTADGVDLGSLY